MRRSNKVWLVLIALGWLALAGSAITTNGFRQSPSWTNWWTDGEKP